MGLTCGFPGDLHNCMITVEWDGMAGADPRAGGAFTRMVSLFPRLVGVLVGSRSETGHVRRRNEDSLLVDEEGGVFAVLDGLGGHPAGDVASARAASALGEALGVPALAEADDPKPLLLSAVEGAHQAILSEVARDDDLTGMATTLVLAGVSGDEAWVVHVGDSRAYLLADDRFRQVTEDHGMGGYLTQALGLEGRVHPDTTKVTLSDGARLLLCTDGLTNMVDDANIAAIVSRGDDPQATCDALVQAALDAGGIDNITVVLLAT